LFQSENRKDIDGVDEENALTVKPKDKSAHIAVHDDDEGHNDHSHTQLDIVLDEKTIGFVLLSPSDDEKKPNAHTLAAIRGLIDKTLKISGDYHFVSGKAPVTHGQETEVSALHVLEMNEGVIRISQRS